MCLRIALASSDKTLIGFFREVLTETFGADCSLSQISPECASSDSDICIWDCATWHEGTSPDLIGGPNSPRHWFLLKQSEAAILNARGGSSEINVLLKPLTRPALREFFTAIREQIERDKRFLRSFADETRRERDRMLQWLIETNYRLTAVEKEADNFVARLLYDLNAPLTTINGYCALFLDGDLGTLSADQRRTLGAMQSSAQRASRLVDTLHQLRVKRASGIKSDLDKPNISETVEHALNEVGPYLEAKRISLTVDVDRPPAELVFERLQVEQALINLLENACKFAPREGMIGIRGCAHFWERRTAKARLSVQPERRLRHSSVLNAYRIDIKDSGPLVSAAQIDQIFDESAAYSKEQERSVGGLGLAVCRMILRRHKGDAWVENSASGPVFSLILPFQSATVEIERLGNGAFTELENSRAH